MARKKMKFKVGDIVEVINGELDGAEDYTGHKCIVIETNLSINTRDIFGNAHYNITFVSSLTLKNEGITRFNTTGYYFSNSNLKLIESKFEIKTEADYYTWLARR